MDNRCVDGWGEKEKELTIPLWMDQKPIRKRQERKAKNPRKQTKKRRKSKRGWILFLEWLGLLILMLLAAWLQR